MSEEIWKDIKGFENLYQVSNYGRVKKMKFYNMDRPVILSIKKTKKRGKYSYNTISLIKDKKVYTGYIHKLVAEAFIPNENNYKYIRFIDGDKSNCHYQNLQWSTKCHKMIRCNETNEVFISQKDIQYKMCLSHSAISLHLRGRREKVGRTINGVREYFTFRYI